jgi:hypothetical protein
MATPATQGEIWEELTRSPQACLAVDAAGLLCSGGLNGSVFRISSTSAATPMVVRALANGTLLPPPAEPSVPVGANAKPLLPTLGPRLVRPDGGKPGTMRSGPYR